MISNIDVFLGRKRQRLVTESTVRNVFLTGVAVLFTWGIFAAVQIQENQATIESAIAQAKELGQQEGRESAGSGNYAVYVFFTVNQAGEEITQPFGGDLGIDIECWGLGVELRWFYVLSDDLILDTIDETRQFDDLDWLEIDGQRLKEQLRTSSYYAASFNSAMRGVLPVSSRPSCVRE